MLYNKKELMENYRRGRIDAIEALIEAIEASIETFDTVEDKVISIFELKLLLSKALQIAKEK